MPGPLFPQSHLICAFLPLHQSQLVALTSYLRKYRQGPRGEEGGLDFPPTHGLWNYGDKTERNFTLLHSTARRARKSRQEEPRMMKTAYAAAPRLQVTTTCRAQAESAISLSFSSFNSPKVSAIDTYIRRTPFCQQSGNASRARAVKCEAFNASSYQSAISQGNPHVTGLSSRRLLSCLSLFTVRSLPTSKVFRLQVSLFRGSTGISRSN